MSQKTFDGKKPYGFLKSIILYSLRPKITYAGKNIKFKNKIIDENITIVRRNYMFLIKYIENNLVFNKEGECFAYYELIPYNYSFL